MRRHLTPSNLIATLALFLALAGGSYAAFKLPKNSVGARSIKTDAVRGRQVKESTLAKVPAAAKADAADRATTADHATAADSSGTATKAERATTADGADHVGGLTADQLKLRCPAGTRPEFGGCLELTAHDPATPLAAVDDCSKRGGRMLSWLELRWVASQSDIVWADGNSQTYELTGEPYNTAIKETLAIDQSANVLNVPPSGTQRYRCVLAQVNG